MVKHRLAMWEVPSCGKQNQTKKKIKPKPEHDTVWNSICHFIVVVAAYSRIAVTTKKEQRNKEFLVPFLFLVHLNMPLRTQN